MNKRTLTVIIGLIVVLIIILSTNAQPMIS